MSGGPEYRVLVTMKKDYQLPYECLSATKLNGGRLNRIRQEGKVIDYIPETRQFFVELDNGD